MEKVQKEVTLLKSFVLEDAMEQSFKEYNRFSFKDSMNNYTLEMLASDVNELKKDSFQLTESGQNKLKGKIEVKKNKMLFFSIPFDTGWTAKVDGKKTELQLINVGFMGIPLIPGSHVIELEFMPRFVKTGSILTACSLVIYAFLIWWKTRKVKIN